MDKITLGENLIGKLDEKELKRLLISADKADQRVLFLCYVDGFIPFVSHIFGSLLGPELVVYKDTQRFKLSCVTGLYQIKTQPAKTDISSVIEVFVVNGSTCSQEKYICSVAGKSFVSRLYRYAGGGVVVYNPDMTAIWVDDLEDIQLLSKDQKDKKPGKPVPAQREFTGDFTAPFDIAELSRRYLGSCDESTAQFEVKNYRHDHPFISNLYRAEDGSLCVQDPGAGLIKVSSQVKTLTQVHQNASATTKRQWPVTVCFETGTTKALITATMHEAEEYAHNAIAEKIRKGSKVIDFFDGSKRVGVRVDTIMWFRVDEEMDDDEEWA